MKSGTGGLALVQYNHYTAHILNWTYSVFLKANHCTLPTQKNAGGEVYNIKYKPQKI